MKASEQLVELQKSLNSLGEDVSAVQELLNPVLIPKVNERAGDASAINASSAGKPIDLEMSPLSQELGCAIEQVRSITHVVRDIMARIAL